METTTFSKRSRSNNPNFAFCFFYYEGFGFIRSVISLKTLVDSGFPDISFPEPNKDYIDKLNLGKEESTYANQLILLLGNIKFNPIKKKNGSNTVWASKHSKWIKDEQYRIVFSDTINSNFAYKNQNGWLNQAFYFESIEHCEKYGSNMKITLIEEILKKNLVLLMNTLNI